MDVSRIRNRYAVSYLHIKTNDNYVEVKMNYKVSIIIPVYNTRIWLNRCIDSVTKQSYSNLEIILVDDGSTDGSGMICDQWKCVDSRIKVIHKINEGLSSARNAGLDICKGEYVFFLDSDDYIHEECIEILLDEIINNNADVAVCGVKYVYSSKIDGKIAKSYNIQKLLKNEIFNKFVEFDREFDLVIACNKLYKFDIINQFRFPIGRFHEDEFILYKILHVVSSIVIVYEDMYYYFQREGSIVHLQLTKKRLEDAIQAIEDRQVFFRNNYPDLLDKVYRNDVLYFTSELAKFNYKNDVKNILFKKAIELSKLNIQSLSFKERMYVKTVIRFPFLYKTYKIIFK